MNFFSIHVKYNPFQIYTTTLIFKTHNDSEFSRSYRTVYHKTKYFILELKAFVSSINNGARKSSVLASGSV